VDQDVVKHTPHQHDRSIEQRKNSQFARMRRAAAIGACKTKSQPPHGFAQTRDHLFIKRQMMIAPKSLNDSPRRT
jgi:hypothetical protein